MACGQLHPRGSDRPGNVDGLFEIGYGFRPLLFIRRCDIKRISQYFRRIHGDLKAILLFHTQHILTARRVHIIGIRLRSPSPNLHAVIALLGSDLENFLQMIPAEQ